MEICPLQANLQDGQAALVQHTYRGKMEDLQLSGMGTEICSSGKPFTASQTITDQCLKFHQFRSFILEENRTCKDNYCYSLNQHVTVTSLCVGTWTFVVDTSPGLSWLRKQSTSFQAKIRWKKILKFSNLSKHIYH